MAPSRGAAAVVRWESASDIGKGVRSVMAAAQPGDAVGGRVDITGAVARRGQALSNGELNRLSPEDHPVHQWYRFVLSYPPHLVRTYLERFSLNAEDRVLDPFCGTGTTVVECKKQGVPSVGVEANPMAHFASRTKADWTPDPDGLRRHATLVAERTLRALQQDGVDDQPSFGAATVDPAALQTLSPELSGLLLTGSMSPLPLHKVLTLLNGLRACCDERYAAHEQLALAKALVFGISNLQFGPEVGVGPRKADAPVVAIWLAGVQAIADDLTVVQSLGGAESTVWLGDSRQVVSTLPPNSVSAVITSPPYPNEKDYTRTTRLESVLLGFIQSKDDLRALKRSLVRSNTRGVYKLDDDDQWVTEHAEIQRIAQAIEARRLELGKTSGFERMYARVTKLYFGGMAQHLAELRAALRPGAHLAYVVGDQASYLRVMIRTGQILADIASSLGYQVESIDLFRTRLATATREQLREEVVVLRWPE
jgi:DNA modification methylase